MAKHTSFKEIINELLKFRYNKISSYKYIERISNIKQEKYYLIETYLSEIKKLCNKLAVCNDWSQKETENKIEEYFLKQLNDTTKFEIQKLNIYKTSDIINMIQRIEEFGINSLTKTMEESISYTEKPNQPNIYEQKQTNPEKGKKFCKIHKWCKHTTEECRNSNKSNNLMMKESETIPKNIEINIKHHNHKINSIIDTGAVYSYINKNLARKLNLKITNLKNTKVEIASGELIDINEETEIVIKIENDKKREYKVKFRLLENKNIETILGMDFLINNSAIINLKDMFINLDEKEYEISIRKSIVNEFDKSIIEKTNIFKIDENQKQIEFINEIKSNNVKSGLIKNAEHEIELHKAFHPKIKNYTVPLGLKNNVNEHLKKLLETKIIKRSNAYNTSPTFVILKKNKDLRLVTDFRELNQCTIKKSYPIPKISNLLNQLNNKKIFSQIDLKAGYYQIQIKESDKHKTAFSINNETYEYNRMAFGLTNAPFYFQKTLNKILYNYNKNILVYLDDILIFSENIEEHYRHIKEICNKLYENDININFEKSSFFKEEIKYLGVIINTNEVKT